MVQTIAEPAAEIDRWDGFESRPNALALAQEQGVPVFGIALAITSGSLAPLHFLTDPTPQRLELSVLVVANLAATALRFALLRGRVFHPDRAH